jgi:hypothetical protein
LGIFIILSPAFDGRFYETTKPPTTLVEELANAVWHFHFLLHIFDQRFILVLEGEPIAHSYVVDRMFVEFAAAAVVFAKALSRLRDDGEDEIASSAVAEHIESILQGSYPTLFPYFSQCLDRGHKDFIWTGPSLQIVPRTESFDAVMPLLTLGELLDFPSHRIYDLTPTTTASSAIPMASTEKRHGDGDSLDLTVEQPKKRRR